MSVTISSEIVLRVRPRVNGAPSRDVRIGAIQVRLVGVTGKSIPVIKDPIDITTDEDDGFRTFLGAAGKKTLDLNIEGTVKTNALRGIFTDNQDLIIEDLIVIFPVIGRNATGDRLEGDFYFSNYNESGGDSAAPIRFNARFRSTGEWDYILGGI